MTWDEQGAGRGRGISIHIPRVGDDQIRSRNKFRLAYFNPHPPCGG